MRPCSGTASPSRVDETKKAVSVGQLQELHAGYDKRLTSVEAGAKSSGDASATIGALSAQLLVLQQDNAQIRAQLNEVRQNCEACMAMMTQMMAKPEKDDTAVLAALAALAEQISRPLTRTGQALLPDGGRIQLQVSETRM